MDAQTRTPKHGAPHRVTIALPSILLTLALGCATDSGVGPPSVPWNQAAVTAAAATFATQMDELYDTAIKEPSFSGERSAYGHTLDNLRILREESRALHAKLANGKTREQTLHSWERIKEITRDERESEAWEFVPTDFSATAKSALGNTQVLDGFFGVR